VKEVRENGSKILEKVLAEFTLEKSVNNDLE
jgi:hypothetical protein